MADDEEEIEMQRFGMSVEDDNDVQYLVAGRLALYDNPLALSVKYNYSY